MIYHTYIPRSPLSKFVKFLWSSEGDNLPSSRVKLLPIGSMELLINLRENTIPLYDSNTGEQCGSTSSMRIMGIHSQSLIIDNHSQISVMGVRFQAGGSVPFFQLPIKELHNRVISLNELWSARANELREKLLKVSQLETRFRILEHYLLTMVQSSPQHPVVDFALDKFANLHPPTVREITNQIGISPRYFGQLFSNCVGLTPKLFCRIQRLRRVLCLLAGKTHTDTDWTDIAFTCGYFDQAHFIHDFRSLALCTPSEYIKHRGLHPCHIVLPD
ncbi:AraC family transcriptional regulator (plasmid) [Calothrix brevissima NIES-22]|nr:AraC family transcriptional regulator [Calothrix brevissima NIES-22]